MSDRFIVLMPYDEDLLNELDGCRVWQNLGEKPGRGIKYFDDHFAKLARQSINIITSYFDMFI